jgi:hypothetical protein
MARLPEPAVATEAVLSWGLPSGRGNGRGGQGCSTDRSTGSYRSGRQRRNAMHGYVVRKRDCYHAVIYEGLDPVTGRERRSWHPAGTDRSEAERLAARLAAECIVRNDGLRSLSFGAYLTRQWFAGQEAHAGHQHLPRLRPQHRAPRPPCRRHHPPARPAATPPRNPLRPAAHPATVDGPWHPSRCTRCPSSSAAAWATPYAVV